MNAHIGNSSRPQLTQRLRVGHLSLAATVLRAVLFLAVLLAPGARDALAQSNTAGSSAEVEITYPDPRGGVGDPIVLGIDVTNADSVEDPRVPTTPGLRTEISRSREFTQTTIIQGRVTRRTSVHYDVVFIAERPGHFELPRVRIVVDGLTYESRTSEVDVVVIDTSSTARAEIVAEPADAVVGQSLSLRLRIWIKPPRASRGAMDLQRLWMQLMLPRNSEWGAFQSAIEEVYNENRWRVPPRVERDPDGAEWFVYELVASASADKPGPLALAPVELRLRYPRPNGGDRVLTILPTPPEIDVAMLPSEGRPADFTGAVGIFEIEGRAKPTRVGVGDPVTLTVTIIDRTPGSADLSRLLPPPIADQADLVRSFRIPTDPLAGTLNGRTKIFTQTLRPLSERVTEIPPITFSYFDPREHVYRTIETVPIPLTVVPAERIDSTAFASGSAAPGAASTPETTLTDVEGGLLASERVTPALLAVDRVAAEWTMGAMVAIPPILAGVVVFWRRRADRLGNNVALRRAMRAPAQARRALASARAAPEFASALVSYIAARSGRASASLTRREALVLVDAAGADLELMESLDRILSAGEQAAYASRTPESASDLRSGSKRILARLDRLDLSEGALTGSAGEVHA